MDSAQDIQRRTSATAILRQPVANPPQTDTPLLGKPSKAQEGPQGWPTQPKPVKISIYVTIWSAMVDIVLFGISASFFAFALIVNSFDRASTTEHPLAKDRLLSASKYGPTVFPILFAAVVGRAAHAVLVWRLERGERLGILDTLASSTSLTSTVMSQFRLRVFTMFGILLVLIWIFSPVGGQATIRQVSNGTTTVPQPALFDYMVSHSNLLAYQDSGRMAMVAVVNTLFNAAIISPATTKKSPRDIWGNVKIPRIEYYEDNTKQGPDGDGWFDTNIGDTQNSDLFASLMGVPMSGLQSPGVVGFKTKLQTMYLNLTCSMPGGNQTESYDLIKMPVDATYVKSERGNSAYLWWKDPDSIPGMANITKSYRSNIAARNGSLEAFRFGYENKIGGYIAAECFLRTTYVEVEVSCADTSNCLVSRIRRSKIDHPSSNKTKLDVQTGPYWNWWLFASAFVASATSRSAYPTLIDYYVAAPETPVLPLRFTELIQPGDVYAVRFGQLMNAYWTCMTGTYTLSAGFSNETSYLDHDTTFRLDDINEDYGTASNRTQQTRLWRTEGTKITSIEIIQAHKGWVAALCVASAILIIASLVPPLVRHLWTKGPGIEINLSSLVTRNNPYILLPASGTYLDASDRARLLKEYKLRFGDVDGGGDTGSLAIGVLDESRGLDIARVQKGRIYE